MGAWLTLALSSWHKTRDLPPLRGHRLTPDNAMIICATWQRSFVSPRRAITLLLYLSSAIHGIRSPGLPLGHRSLAMRDGGRASPHRIPAPGGVVQCQSPHTTSRVRNTRTPAPSASTTCAPVHSLKASEERECCSGRTGATSRPYGTRLRRRSTA